MKESHICVTKIPQSSIVELQCPIVRATVPQTKTNAMTIIFFKATQQLHRCVSFICGDPRRTWCHPTSSAAATTPMRPTRLRQDTLFPSIENSAVEPNPSSSSSTTDAQRWSPSAWSSSSSSTQPELCLQHRLWDYLQRLWGLATLHRDPAALGKPPHCRANSDQRD